MGRHRLLIGDCCKASDVARLMDGRPVNVAVTSPPYASQRKYDEASEFRPIPPDDYGEWFDAVQANVAAHLAPDGSFFLNIKEHCDDGQRHLYVKDLTIRHVREWGWRFVDEFCWRDTRNGVPGGWPNRFKDSWEPVFHFSRAAQIKFRPEANGTSSDGVFAYSAKNAKSTSGSGLLGSDKDGGYIDGVARPSNVLEIPAGGTGEHAAQFPADLPAWFIRSYSDAGDSVLDTFVGSGTTLVACEQEGRDGYGIEISPKYGAVILERLSSMGLTPVLVGQDEHTREASNG
jgi:site-specific DNA-methyltransferase (adenine-specific)/site-specific DNA-methyltransferase (cytosine-N4-specific)